MTFDLLFLLSRAFINLFVQSSQLGISGAYYYAVAVTCQIIIFSIFAMQMRIRAPGATTYLQVIRARFGPLAHLLYCVSALVNTVIVLIMLMLGGCAIITKLTTNLSLEVCLGVIACATCLISLTGGMGSAFYVSYLVLIFTLATVATFVLTIFHGDTNHPGDLGKTALR
ncbi:unnamed protein product [Protopolystoma xenopodis]|uniref:Amino acid permease/ SLC12A domain-containing protein n=1 Tax=Protopolystoma xenopodis TaxID=117903 RepID=A0A448WQN1_9PLAT|nr:unnamed protein product [Protopolystoma xenopodis]